MKTQFPSPMEEHIRPHKRVGQSICEGDRVEINDVFINPAILFIPERLHHQDTADIVFHFHGSDEIIGYATCHESRKLLTVTMNLGSGSSAYERPFQKSEAFGLLLKLVKKKAASRQLVAGNIIISGFSAGYGAIRAILSNSIYNDIIDGVLLLDGMHTDYIPDGQTLYKGGELNVVKLDTFLQFAKAAMNGEKKMLITHSCIFPGTYASTTECTEYIIRSLGLSRIPALEEGPLGMQMVGKSIKGNLAIMAFAGNTAPDHMDHLHGFHDFVGHLLD